MRTRGKFRLESQKWSGERENTMQICRPERPKQILTGCEFVPKLPGSQSKQGIMGH